jgi:hypothetical protein
LASGFGEGDNSAWGGLEMKNEPTHDETIESLNARCERPDEFQNFDRAVRASLNVPKEAVLKEEAKLKRIRARKRTRKPHS